MLHRLILASPSPCSFTRAYKIVPERGNLRRPPFLFFFLKAQHHREWLLGEEGEMEKRAMVLRLLGENESKARR